MTNALQKVISEIFFRPFRRRSKKFQNNFCSHTLANAHCKNEKQITPCMHIQE